MLLCSAHYGSHLSAFFLLHASGFPLATVGRWHWKYDREASSVERRTWDLAYARRVLRHRQRPNIEPWHGRIEVGVQVAAALRGNEVVTISTDAPPPPAERPRTIEVPFLGGRVTLVPGVVTLAEVTGAPLLMAFAHRSGDYRHQVLEISPPVPTDAKPEAAFGRCVAAMEAAIKAHPAEWYFWFQRDNLIRLGLIPAGKAEVDDSAAET